MNQRKLLVTIARVLFWVGLLVMIFFPELVGGAIFLFLFPLGVFVGWAGMEEAREKMGLGKKNRTTESDASDLRR